MKNVKKFEEIVSNLSRLEKAKRQLESIDIYTSIENNTLYVIAGYDTKLELSDYEIDYRAKLFDEERDQDDIERYNL